MILLRKVLIASTAALVYLWIGGTALIVLVGSLFTFAEHSNLGLGLIEVQGVWALLIGVPIGSLGLGAVILLWRKPALGMKFLLAYCAFFLVSLGGDVIKDMLESRKTPASHLQEDLPLLIMIAAFLATAFWAQKLMSARKP
jgi:membrane-bound ClpP family serine protease